MTIDVVFFLNRGALRPMLAALNSVRQNAAAPEALRVSLVVPDDAEEQALIADAMERAFPWPGFSWRIVPTRPPEPIAAYIRARYGTPMPERDFLRRSIHYARLWMTEDLPADMGRFICLDCDVIVIDDIARLWEEARLDQHEVFAASPQLFHGLLYFRQPWKGWAEVRGMGRPFNAGVTVINAPAWGAPVRARLQEILDWNAANGYGLFSLHDEPILNLLFKDYVRFSPRWNRCGYGNAPWLARLLKKPLSETSVIHWSGGHHKPWTRRDVPFGDLWWQYDLGESFDAARKPVPAGRA